MEQVLTEIRPQVDMEDMEELLGTEGLADQTAETLEEPLEKVDRALKVPPEETVGLVALEEQELLEA